MSTEIATVQQALAVGKAGEMGVFRVDFDEFKELIQDNVGANLNKRDLSKITVPAGSTGLECWAIEEGGKKRPVDFIDGIVLYQVTTRTRYRTKYGEGETEPPVCVSEGGLIGIGDPGGDCSKCAFDQWGSRGDGSNAKACGEYKHLFILRGNNIVPDLVSIPPTSTKIAKKFFLSLTSEMKHYSSVLVRLGLRLVDGPTPYFEVTFERLEDLTKEQAAYTRALTKLWKPVFDATVKAEANGENAGDQQSDGQPAGDQRM